MTMQKAIDNGSNFNGKEPGSSGEAEDTIYVQFFKNGGISPPELRAFVGPISRAITFALYLLSRHVDSER